MRGLRSKLRCGALFVVGAFSMNVGLESIDPVSILVAQHTRGIDSTSVFAQLLN